MGLEEETSREERRGEERRGGQACVGVENIGWRDADAENVDGRPDPLGVAYGGVGEPELEPVRPVLEGQGVQGLPGPDAGLAGPELQDDAAGDGGDVPAVGGEEAELELPSCEGGRRLVEEPCAVLELRLGAELGDDGAGGGRGKGNASEGPVPGGEDAVEAHEQLGVAELYGIPEGDGVNKHLHVAAGVGEEGRPLLRSVCRPSELGVENGEGEAAADPDVGAQGVCVAVEREEANLEGASGLGGGREDGEGASNDLEAVRQSYSIVDEDGDLVSDVPVERLQWLLERPVHVEGEGGRGRVSSVVSPLDGEEGGGECGGSEDCGGAVADVVPGEDPGEAGGGGGLRGVEDEGVVGTNLQEAAARLVKLDLVAQKFRHRVDLPGVLQGAAGNLRRKTREKVEDEDEDQDGEESRTRSRSRSRSRSRNEDEGRGQGQGQGRVEDESENEDEGRGR
eukprot:766951-Hanusia_phi.AAC.1